MSIFDTIVSALRSLTGGGTEESTAASGSTGSESDGQVSVEHDPDSGSVAPDASTEAAVKGGDVGAEETDDGAAAGTDAAASTGTLVDEETGKEPAEAVGDPGDGDETTDDDIASEDDGENGENDEDDAEGATGADAAEADDEPDETGSEPAADADETDDAEPAADGSTESVETITGIGPAYAGRLEKFGIETVGELAAADAEEVAEGIDVSESRVSDWIDRARDE
jgi:predicted flap endonuclease-1-like 5' DNA nuclease